MTPNLPSAETPTYLTNFKTNSHHIHHSSIHHKSVEACVGFSPGDPIELPSYKRARKATSWWWWKVFLHIIDIPRVEFSLFIRCSNPLCSFQTNHSSYINPVRRNRNELESPSDMCGDHHNINQRCLKIFRIRRWCLFPISQASTTWSQMIVFVFLGCLEPNEQSNTRL